MRDRLFCVTGGSRGIGAALLARAAADGDVTASVSRGPAVADHHLSADLADPSAWDAVIDWFGGLVRSRQWRTAVFVHNAATLDPIGFAGEVDHAAYTDQVLLNAASPLALGDGLVRTMRESETAGVVAIVTSGAARTPYQGWSGYGPAKAAVDLWVRTVGAELEERAASVKVLAVAPGVVDTDMQRAIRQTEADRFPTVERFRRLHDEGELASPEDVADRFFRLVTDPSVENGAVVDLRSR